MAGCGRYDGNSEAAYLALFTADRRGPWLIE